jgi:hypothetical protein
LAQGRFPASLAPMLQVRISHVHNCNEETFWKLFFDDEYNQRLFKGALGFPRFEQLEFEETDSEIRRVTSVVPAVGDLPRALKKLVGDGFAYEEHGVFDKRTKRFSINVLTSRMADRITFRGVLFTEPMSERSSRRLYEGTVEARIFGVGGLLEKRLAADLEARYADSARFTNEYIAEKGL